jgi:acetate kinase
VIFSGGTGEHNSKIREKICEKLKIFGFEIDLEENKKEGTELVHEISIKNSDKKIFTVHVEEDVEMMRQVFEK